MEKEKRSINIPAKVEIRKDGTVGAIYGYPIVYNRNSEDMGFIERIAPGAAAKALKKSDIRALKNHDPSLIFGRKGVNLKLSEDKDGVRYEATPVDTMTFRQVAEEVRLGLLTGQSFGFTVLADKWSDLETDHPKRTITEIGEIYDVGPVTYPAYVDTSVALRSLEAAKKEVSEEEPSPVLILQRQTEDQITIVVNNEYFTFTGDDRLDRAADKINSMRSAPSPMTADAGSAGPEPMLTNAPDVAKDDLLETIKNTIVRLKQ